jgi:hypothetical protein
MKIGVAVECPHCHRTKAPRGRSISPLTYESYCNRDECPYYWDDPKPGDLFPGETEEQFGFPCSVNATRETAADPEASNA